jgi:hypothetical protein
MRGGRLWASRPIPIPPGIGARVARQRCPILRSGLGCCSQRLPGPPLVLEFLGREGSEKGTSIIDYNKGTS